MQIIPAIDLREGRVVRLFQGDFGKETRYSDDPAQVAKRWEEEGASLLHVVDLEGALQGKPVNLKWVGEIAKAVSCPVECGGGVRDLETIQKLLATGVKRVVLGTQAIQSEAFLKECLLEFGDNVAVGIDSRKREIKTEGWTKTVTCDPVELAKRFESLGVSTLIVTDIAKDGTLKGPNLSLFRQLLKAVRIPLIASGGVSSLKDLEALRNLSPHPPWGAIVGTALYEGKFTLREAMSHAG